MPSVFLYSSEPILAGALARTFCESGKFTLCGSCSGLSELRDALVRLEPDVLLLDLTANVDSSMLEMIRKAAVTTKTVLWVRNMPGGLVRQAVSLGVRGVLRRNLPSETLIRCLSRVEQGELWFERALTEPVMVTSRYTLTRRESEAVALLSQGLKNREIATAMEISEGSVKVYLSRLFRKLGVHDRFELALFGLKEASSTRSAASGPVPIRSRQQPFVSAPGMPARRVSPIA